MFKDQLPALNEPKINPFIGTEGPQDEEQLPLFMVVDEDEDNDIDIKLQLFATSKIFIFCLSGK